MKSLVFYCGNFGVFDDFCEPDLSLDQRFIKNNTSIFFVQAKGDSMSPYILDKDILIVDTSITLSRGQVGTFFFNSNPICKRLEVRSSKKFLVSINNEYSEIEIKQDDNLEVFGVVIGLARDFYE